MTIADLQSKLQTHKPRLLTAKEAGMSGGPYTAELPEVSDCAPAWKILDKFDCHIAKVYGSNPANARFIAAASTWPELLWEYGESVLDEAKITKGRIESGRYDNGHDECNARAKMNYSFSKYYEILLALDSAGRLGWVEKERVS